LYTTTLPPRAAGQLLDLHPSIETILQSGNDYAIWDSAQRFQYVVDIATQINQIAKFSFVAPSKKFFKQTRWENILHWWLDVSVTRRGQETGGKRARAFVKGAKIRLTR
jgi:hypothetical protein